MSFPVIKKVVLAAVAVAVPAPLPVSALKLNTRPAFRPTLAKVSEGVTALKQRLRWNKNKGKAGKAKELAAELKAKELAAELIQTCAGNPRECWELIGKLETYYGTMFDACTKSEYVRYIASSFAAKHNKFFGMTGFSIRYDDYDIFSRPNIQEGFEWLENELARSKPLVEKAGEAARNARDEYDTLATDYGFSTVYDIIESNFLNDRSDWKATADAIQLLVTSAKEMVNELQRE